MSDHFPIFINLNTETETAEEKDQKSKLEKI